MKIIENEQLIMENSEFSTLNSKLPDGWRWVKLGEVCEFIRGVTFNSSESTIIAEDNYTPVLRAGNINQELLLREDLIWVPDYKIDEKQYLRPKDIVICMSSGSPKVVGKTAQLNKDWRGSVGAFCGIVRSRILDSADYVSFWFRSPLFMKWRDSQARGANIQNLRFSQFEKVPIPLPPLPEQKRIAKILTEQMAAAAKAKKACEEKLAAAEKLPASFLNQIFNSKKAKQWPMKKLGEVCCVRSGEFLPLQKMDSNGTYPVYGGNGINGYHSDHMLTAPTIVIGRVGALCGCIHITQPKAWITDNALYVSKKTINFDNVFLAEYLKFLNLNQYSQSMAQPLVSGKIIYPIEIHLPPLPEQKQIAKILTQQMAATEKTKKIIEEELELINKLPASLLQQAFTGDI